MIIRSFSIDRFGIFAGQGVPELSPGLNIFLGDNEAGKSTLLSFFRAMFFGYQRAGRNRFDYLGSGVTAALSGGSLALSSGQGTHFNLIRRPGRHGGELSLAGTDGRALPASFLAELLGGYTDKMYDQVFCFGYNDLANLSGMNEQDVAGALHAAAFGTGFKSPLEVGKALLDSQKKLFSPRATSTPIYRNFKYLGEVRGELARIGSELGRYNALKDEREALSAEHGGLAEKSRELSFALMRAQSLMAAWPEWSALGEVRAALAMNPHPGGEFSVESIERFDEIAGGLEAVLAERREKGALLENGRESLKRLTDFAALDGIWPDCQSLQGRRGSLQKALAALPGRETVLEAARERQDGLIRGLGSGWNLERVLEFEISLLLQEGVDLGRQSLESAGRAAEQAGVEVARLESEAREARAEAQAVRCGFGQSDPDSFVVHAEAALYSPMTRARLEFCGLELGAALQAENDAYGRISGLENEASALSEELEASRAGLAGCREEAALAAAAAKAALRPPLFGLSTARGDTRRVPWLLLCLVISLLCFSGAYKYFDVTAVGQTSWQKFTDIQAWKAYLSFEWLRFGLGLLFLWGAFYWLAPRAATLGLWKPKDMSAQFVSPQEREALSRADALAGRILAQEAQLARVVSGLEAARAAAQDAARSARSADLAWKEQAALHGLDAECPPEAALRIFDACAVAALSAKRARSAADNAVAARLRLDEAGESWRRWLAGQGFDPAFTPETVRLAILRIQQVKEQAAIVADHEAELRVGQDEIASFGAALDELYARSGFRVGPGGEGNGLLQRFDALYKAAFEAHEEVLRLKERELELEKLAAELLRLEELAGSCSQRLAGILEQGGAADEADYRLRFKRQAAHLAIRREEERLLARLEQAAGQAHSSGQALWNSREDFMLALGASGREALEERSVALRDELAALEGALSERLRRQGEIKAQLENLENGRGSAELQAREAALKDELKTLARDWGVAALAGNFIRQARRSFEEERHDSVIRQAGEIFAGLTGSRYRQMLFDLGGKDGKAYAVNGSGESLDSETALSQGAREQLYLALRLAFIRQHNLTKESLPLIMDDILVNFDPGRTRNAAEIFAAFSAENQELFFTCHPHVAALLRDFAPKASCFSLKDGCISPLDQPDKN